MAVNLLGILALLAWAAIAAQASMNAQLGVLLRNSTLATAIAFAGSMLVTLLALLLSQRPFPRGDEWLAVPPYLWFGGALSALGVGLFYYLIPKMGVGPMMSFALTGQILVAMLASHYGWFGLPVRSVDALKLLGIAALLAGILLINWRQT
ncbi:DMT family transporter [Bowmanella dokdonensis]|uniref:DMT family transporter n=1 Tax=Bowmanella dokdonensis TaxID=751969 RepID=A0A939IRG7_9ALTE|nr:DMT family transporter [Bowmanella dokdonensis]MBN7825632.1 DMT family transporter [Bowmanella dokdonensis]